MRSEALAASSAFRVNRVGTTGMPKESSKRNAASAGRIPAGNLECDRSRWGFLLIHRFLPGLAELVIADQMAQRAHRALRTFHQRHARSTQWK